MVVEQEALESEDSFEPFTESGESSDEIGLIFNDGDKLYVSENFLSYASPVFKAMFKHDFKEKETREVAIKEKSYEDFLEFLLCLHPGVQKPIDNDNVLRVVSLAEVYQVKVFVTRCQEVMKTWLTIETMDAAVLKNFKKATHAKNCLTILTKAIACGYEDLITYAIHMIARFGYEIFTGYDRPAGFAFGTLATNKPHPPRSASQPLGILKPLSISNPTEDCKRLFESLPESERRNYC